MNFRLACFYLIGLLAWSHPLFATNNRLITKLDSKLDSKLSFDMILLSSFAYHDTSKIFEASPAFGVAFTVGNLVSMRDFHLNLRSDLFQESMHSEEGSLEVKIERKYFRQWISINRSLSNRLLMGVALGMGVSQSMVRTQIQNENSKSYGALEPLWGWSIDGQYDLQTNSNSELFLNLAIRRLFANNYIKNERNELDFGVGFKF